MDVFANFFRKFSFFRKIVHVALLKPRFPCLLLLFFLLSGFELLPCFGSVALRGLRGHVSSGRPQGPTDQASHQK